MKKIFLLTLATAMTLVGCQEKEQDAPVNPNEGGSAFELVAEIAQTKTTLDAETYKVEWESGDVIYMVTSDGTWGASYADDNAAETIAEFTYADGKFTSDATIAEGEYTFKGMYAAASQKSFHRGASSIHKLEATQTQDCTDPTAHIKANDALVGTFAASVPMTETAKMNMSHLYTLMQVNVKNTTGAAIEVTKFEMTAAGADLAGIFNVEAFDTPAISTKYGASSTITVNVTGGTVANNESLPVYFVMAPLTDYSGDVTFKVTDASGNTYTKTVTLSGITFAAGKYNTTPYTISSADEVEPAPEGTVTFDFTSSDELSSLGVELPESSAGTNITSLSKGDVTFTVETNGSTATRIWNSSGSYELRVYKNAVLTLSVPDGFIISDVTITGNSISSISKSDIPGNPAKLTVASTASSTQKVSTITVNYSEGGETPEPENKTLVSITVEDPQTEYTVGDLFVEPTVKATYNDESAATVTGATFSGYDLTSEGTQEVTVSYTEGEVTATTTYEISVSAAEILVEDGTYVIAVKEDGVYYAASTEENGARRAYVELSGYSSGDYVSHDSKIVWTIENSGAGITVSSGEQYWDAVKNGVSLVESSSAAVVSIAKSETEGAYLLSADCGSDGVRYLSKNGTYGFGFYAELNKEDIYLIPATFVELPNLDAPVVTAELNSDETGIDVSWTAVDNATSYVVSCTNQDDVTVTSGTAYLFTELAAGTYTITVTAKAENYNSATSAAVEVVVPAAEGETTLKTFVVKSGDIVSGNSYAKYDGTVDNRSWVITYGGNNKSVGTNSKNRANCTLSSYSKYAVGSVTTSSTASAFASTTSISNVSKISYAALSGGSNQTYTNIYVLYSADGNTFSQISLTSGTQGASVDATIGGEFEFASCSGYFAIVFVATNTSGNWRLDDVNLTFTYTE